MKISNNRILFLLTGLLLVVGYACHRKAEKSIAHSGKPIEKKSPGKIVFDKEIHNFGTLKDGEIVAYSFIFHNTGGSPLKIIKSEKSCGCVELNFSPEEVAPGGSAAVEFVLNTEGEWGNLIKEATIETSAGEKKELKISAYVENKQFNLLNTQK